MGLHGETLSEGQLQTREAEVAEFFQALPPGRVVMEVGTHSAGCRKSSRVRDTRWWWPTRG